MRSILNQCLKNQFHYIIKPIVNFISFYFTTSSRKILKIIHMPMSSVDCLNYLRLLKPVSIIISLAETITYSSCPYPTLGGVATTCIFLPLFLSAVISILIPFLTMSSFAQSILPILILKL